MNPTLPSLFPDVDWLIGNHSDELTPWIPVMAARWVYPATIKGIFCSVHLSVEAFIKSYKYYHLLSH